MRWVWKPALNLESTSIFPTPLKPVSGLLRSGNRKKDFEEFAERRLKPAVTKLGIQRETTVAFQPLHNFFGPRINELPGLIGRLPSGPNT
jgi:hypothetical protein